MFMSRINVMYRFSCVSIETEYNQILVNLSILRWNVFSELYRCNYCN